MQKASFYNAKGRLLRAKKRPFILREESSRLSNHYNILFHAQLSKPAYGINQAAEVVRMHVADVAYAERVGL